MGLILNGNGVLVAKDMEKAVRFSRPLRTMEKSGARKASRRRGVTRLGNRKHTGHVQVINFIKLKKESADSFTWGRKTPVANIGWGLPSWKAALLSTITWGS